MGTATTGVLRDQTLRLIRIEITDEIPLVQSPKFKFIKDELKDVFSISLLKEEWKERTRAQIRKQAIFDPIEYRDFNENISAFSLRLSTSLLEGTYSVRTPKRYLSEKSRGLCRQMTLIHPLDLLVLERLSRSMYFELKRKAPSKSAFFEPDDGSFGKGLTQIDLQYGSYASWRRFQKAVFGFANENNYVVTTDVANFYDFINFQHLRNIVSSLADMRESILDLLIFVLNRLTWTPNFMPITQVGMPQIETSATRVLANAMLYEVDKICESSAISNYARFMDDMDIGVDKIADAKLIIRDIDLTLQSRQLRLNSSKTKILDKKAAFEHFCIKENIILSNFQEKISIIPPTTAVRRKLIARYEEWLCRTSSGGPGDKSRFRNGNGSKIHKYILRLIYQVGLSVPEADLIWLVKNEPSMRSVAFRYLSKSSSCNSTFDEIFKILISNIFVDDTSMIDMTNFLLHSRFDKTIKFSNKIQNVCKILIEKSDIGLHCAIFISGKFLPRSAIIEILRKNIDRMHGDFWLCRASAGLYPIFFKTPEFFKYNSVIEKIGLRDTVDVTEYFVGITNASTFSVSVREYLKAPNSTYSQNLYFPKVLLLLAAAKNPNITKLFPDMHVVHPALKADPYFCSMGF